MVSSVANFQGGIRGIQGEIKYFRKIYFKAPVRIPLRQRFHTFSRSCPWADEL